MLHFQDFPITAQRIVFCQQPKIVKNLYKVFVPMAKQT